MMERLIQMLAATAELMGAQLSGVALAIMAKDFAEYDIQLIEKALKNVRLNQTRFTQAAIQKEIENLMPDGRPGADEAWAMYPHDEAVSAVITQEIAEAMQVAQPLINEGDMIAARMAFKEAYTRIVAHNKASDIPVKWFPSLGHCPEGREQTLKRAVELGRLTADHAQSLLPAPKDNPINQFIGEMKFLTAQQLTDAERDLGRKKMAEIRLKLGKKAA